MISLPTHKGRPDGPSRRATHTIWASHNPLSSYLMTRRGGHPELM